MTYTAGFFEFEPCLVSFFCFVFFFFAYYELLLILNFIFYFWYTSLIFICKYLVGFLVFVLIALLL
jgi:hypothetical protein